MIAPSAGPLVAFSPRVVAPAAFARGICRAARCRAAPATVDAVLDHLVLATPDLAASVAALTADGIALVEGGPHVGVGTRNHLAGLGDGRYLEVVGPDPEQPEPGSPRPFRINTLDAPRLLTWAVRVPDLDAALVAARAGGHDPGGARPMSRRRPDGELLAWTLAFPPDDLGGVVPFVIDWGATRHPSASLDDGARLGGLRLGHSDPDRLRSVLHALGADTGEVDVEASTTPRLTARLVLADGTETILS